LKEINHDMSDRRLLGIYAHPDDEISIGATLLAYRDAGVDTGLICATRGEAGEIADPALATPENLAEVREGELRAAAEILGVEDLWILPFRDSGMAGTPENQDPRSLIQTDESVVVRDLVAIIREFRPQVVVTFEPGGAYGHPDHIAISRQTHAAYEAAADSARFPGQGAAHAVSKLYYSGIPRSLGRALGEAMRARNYQGGLRDLDPESLGLPDDQISVRIDASPWQEAKDRARSMHATQRNSGRFMEEMPEEIRRQWSGQECFQLATSRVGPDVPGENDLFARVAHHRGNPC
jgi:LmbE family N-acetylglucosaminyl deacetylase